MSPPTGSVGSAGTSGSTPAPAASVTGPSDGHHFRIQIGYVPSFAASDVRFSYNGAASPDYDFHIVDATVGWQFTSERVDFNLAARLGIGIFNPADARYRSSPGSLAFNPSLYVTLHGRPARWIGLGGGFSFGPQIWTGGANVGIASAYLFDPNVGVNFTPEATVRFYPVAGLTLDVGGFVMINGGFSAPPPRDGDPVGTIAPTVASGGGMARVGYAF